MRARGRFWVLAALTAIGSATLAPHTAAQSAPDTNLFRVVARQQTNIVVAIRTTRWLDTTTALEGADAFERLFGALFPKGPQRRQEYAAGILISADGDILTNDHVVAEAEVIEVHVPGRETTPYRATVVGRDPLSDSALLKLVNGPRDLPAALLGDSSTLETGDWVMAIGNPFHLGQSVTVGVVGHPGRVMELPEGHWQRLIQTDASINPGSSGGPLLNTRGEVVGINLATLTDGLGENMGIGFAVPINTVKAVLAQLRTGRVVHGSLGVQARMSVITDADAMALGLPAARGALLIAVQPGSTAEAAGLRAGDVIIELLGAPIHTAEDLVSRVSLAQPGLRAHAVFIRDGHRCAIDVVIEALVSPLSHRPQRPVDRRAHFGLTLVDAASGVGALVQQVEESTAAANADIEPGDILRKVNTRVVRSAAEARDALERVPEGSTVFLLIRRLGAEQLVDMEAR